MPQLDFSSLEGVFQQFSPSDMLGTVTPDLGHQPNVQDANTFEVLRGLLENSGRGVYTAADLKDKLNAVTQAAPGADFDLSTYLDFYSTQGFIDALGKLVDASKTYQGPDGSKQQVSGIQEIVGKDFPLHNGKLPFDVTMVVSRAPYFSPMTRNTKKAEIFLNSMPNTVLSQLVPFLQVEFQLTRSPAQNLQTPGLLKFLLGAPALNQGSPATANDAMVAGHQIGTDQGSSELDFAGMEMFTSPQTLVNPQPNLDNGVGTSGRYADVIDPFRPFASIESLNVSIVPAGAGFYTYKKAQLTIKVHDRSRLSELSDFIRPRVYTGVTVWLTYGWRAPDRPGENPYFDYINNNMLMREAYGIINSNFSFDQVGQVTLTLELFTKGVSEMRQSKVSDNNNDINFQFDQLRRVGEKIAEYRQALHLDPQAGLNKELRPFQVLDAAEQGTFPANAQGAKDIGPAIQQLTDILNLTKGIDATAANGLIATLKDYYSAFNKVDPVTGKLTLPDALQTRVTATIQAMFEECTTGPDPFLPASVKSSDPGAVPTDLATALDSFNKAPSTNPLVKKNRAVSFGKLFTVFAVRNLISAQTVDELQVFFYPMNESCGPCSSISVAAFPIDMPMFLDQYREHVIRNAGERITLEDFLGLVVNAQFLDPRAIGYGMKAAYNPYDPKDPAAKLKDKQGDDHSFLGRWQKKYGTFKQPTIEMFIEVSHQRVSEAGQGDILQLLSYSARDASTIPPAKAQELGSRRIMRIHLYDKQVNPYRTPGQLLSSTVPGGGKQFVQLPATDYARKLVDNAAEESQGNFKQALNAQVTFDQKTGVLQLTNVTSNQQIKDIVSKQVPTIRFGCNGTTVLQAALASKADPRLSTVQMLRTMTIRNGASANGSGEGGIPLRVIPAQLNLTTLGNPLISMAQLYMFDAQSGTTLDNLYIVTGLQHNITPGKFETQVQLGYSDGYGVFEGAVPITQFISNLAADVSSA